MQCHFRNEYNLCPKASCHGDGRAQSGGRGRPIAVTLQVGQVNSLAAGASMDALSLCRWCTLVVLSIARRAHSYDILKMYSWLFLHNVNTHITL